MNTIDLTETEFEQIPIDMREADNWVLWKYEQVPKNDGTYNLTKVPYVNLTKRASSTDKSTWNNFDSALTLLQTQDVFDGLGFMFDGNYMGFDLDDIPEQIESVRNGETDSELFELLEAFETYAEVSPSGNGVHIYFKGSLPDKGFNNRSEGKEMYDSARYFTVTGNQLRNYNSLVDGTEIIKPYYEKFRPHTKSEVSNEYDSFEDIPSYGNGLTKDEVLRAIEKDKQARKFLELHVFGNWEMHHYPSRSDAELALVGKYGFYSDYDKNIMDQLFQESELYDEKWDRNSSPTKVYTIAKVINNRPEKGGYKAKNGSYSLTLNKKDKWYSYDDTGNAERFYANYGNDFLYNTTAKNWFLYDGIVWKADETMQAYKHATKIADIINDEPIFVSNKNDKEEVERAQKAKDSHWKKTRSNRGKINLLNDVSSMLAVSNDKFDSSRNVLNLQNGYFDFDKRKLLEHDRKLFLTKVGNASYDSTAKSPMWEKFIKETFLGDVDLINYVQRAVGYSLSNKTTERQAFILYGDGNNGKSVFTSVLEELLGTYAQNVNPEAIMTSKNKDGNSASPALAKLTNTRLVTTAESGERMELDEGLVKRMTGNDKISARFLHANEITFTPEFKLWMGTNHKPIIRSNGYAIWNRIVLIPFENKVTGADVDIELTDKLKSELDGILNWAIEGYYLYELMGLRNSEPQIIKEQRDEYQFDMDPVGQFINNRCVLDTQIETKSSDLWGAYKTWAENNNEHVGTSQKFYKEMNSKFEKVRRSDGSYLVGVSLK